MPMPKKRIVILSKEDLEDYSEFQYVPDGYWEEIEFDTAPFLVGKKEIKLNGGVYYEYDFWMFIAAGYVEGWKINVHHDDVEKFEQPLRSTDNEELIKKLESIIGAKQMLMATSKENLII